MKPESRDCRPQSQAWWITLPKEANKQKFRSRAQRPVPAGTQKTYFLSVLQTAILKAGGWVLYLWRPIVAALETAE